jgi:hypothetical protein
MEPFQVFHDFGSNIVPWAYGIEYIASQEQKIGLVAFRVFDHFFEASEVICSSFESFWAEKDCWWVEVVIAGED